MPRGPKGEKRPADVIGNAVKVMKIAVGEETEDAAPEDGKNKAAQALGKLGGAARLIDLLMVSVLEKPRRLRWLAIQHRFRCLMN